MLASQFVAWIRRLARLLIFWLALLIWGGCATVGPDYVAPKVALPPAWPANFPGGLSRVDFGPSSLATWWTNLNDPDLNQLIERAVAGNLESQQARSRLREARARRGITRAERLPSVNASSSASWSRSSGNAGGGQVKSLVMAGFDAGWELDIFGGGRRAVEAAEADWQASAEDWRSVIVSLLAEVALNYVDIRTWQARLAVAQGNLAAEENTRQLVAWRAQAGLADELALQQASLNLESNRSQLPLLQSSLAAALNRLDVLLGQQPGSIPDEPWRSIKAIPRPPDQIAVGVPADIIRQRPDVRRAERQLAAQTARIGVASADLYPSFKLIGSIGLEALALGKQSGSGGLTFSSGPQISWPIFNAGAIRQNIVVQSARQEQARLQYEAVLLASLEEVENALVAYAAEDHRRASLEKAMQAASTAVELAHRKYQAGQTDFSVVLDAERSRFSLQDQLVQSEGAVTAGVIAIYKALGGGWTSLAPENLEKTATPAPTAEGTKHGES
jgi:NodT family efflux transporter outer membrane factor (OMF) lipoprotein